MFSHYIKVDDLIIIKTFKMFFDKKIISIIFESLESLRNYIMYTVLNIFLIL